MRRRGPDRLCGTVRRASGSAGQQCNTAVDLERSRVSSRTHRSAARDRELEASRDAGRQRAHRRVRREKRRQLPWCNRLNAGQADAVEGVLVRRGRRIPQEGDRNVNEHRSAGHLNRLRLLGGRNASGLARVQRVQVEGLVDLLRRALEELGLDAGDVGSEAVALTVPRLSLKSLTLTPPFALPKSLPLPPLAPRVALTFLTTYLWWPFLNLILPRKSVPAPVVGSRVEPPLRPNLFGFSLTWLLLQLLLEVFGKLELERSAGNRITSAERHRGRQQCCRHRHCCDDAEHTPAVPHD